MDYVVAYMFVILLCCHIHLLYGIDYEYVAKDVESLMAAITLLFDSIFYANMCLFLYLVNNLFECAASYRDVREMHTTTTSKMSAWSIRKSASILIGSFPPYNSLDK